MSSSPIVRGVYLCWYGCAWRERDEISSSYVYSSLINSPSFRFFEFVNSCRRLTTFFHRRHYQTLIKVHRQQSVARVKTD